MLYMHFNELSFIGIIRAKYIGRFKSKIRSIQKALKTKNTEPRSQINHREILPCAMQEMTEDSVQSSDY